MKKSILSLLALSASFSFASETIKCDVTNLKTKAETSIFLQLSSDMKPIQLGDGRTFEINFFGDDIRFTEQRPPTSNEKAAFDAKRGGREIGLSGVITAYAQTACKGDIDTAMFSTENVSVNCELVK